MLIKNPEKEVFQIKVLSSDELVNYAQKIL